MGSVVHMARTERHQDGVQTHVSADSSSSSQTEETAAVREHWSKAQSWTLTAVKRGAGPDGAHLGVFVDADAPQVIRLLDPSGARHLLPATGVRPQPSPAAAAGIAGSQEALCSKVGLSLCQPRRRAPSTGWLAGGALCLLLFQFNKE
eukprot:SAG25_NODE_158_length_13455_cov_15.344714_17_plen_148_part_00